MLVSTIVSLALALAAPPAADFYVAPGGNDAAAGTQDAPFASIARAQVAVQGLVKAGLKKDVTVCVRGGTYALDAPLAFGSADSGTEQFAITYQAYPGEEVRISGGRAITGWTKAAKGLWTVQLPEAKSGGWYFRQLWADGTRLPRGRFPNEPGLLRVKSVSPDVKHIVMDQSPGVDNLAGSEAELVMYQNWSISRGPIVSSDGATLHLPMPLGWIGHGAMTTASPHKPAIIENALEFVDQPGEWYLDRKTGVLTYMAAEGEDPNAREFIAPVLEKLLVVAGSAKVPVRNLHFAGLAFEHTAWPLPAFGYMGIQAGHYGTDMKSNTHVLPPALHFAYATDCAVTDCRIARHGGTAVGFGPSCDRNTVAGSELFDIGGNGILVGWRGRGHEHTISWSGNASLSSDWPDPKDVPQANVISNNYIHDCGAINHGCVGIFDAFCTGTTISHNHVTNMPYTGISIGFRWNMTSTSQRDTLVEYNHVHDVMKKLADGGCIYTLGLQPGTVLRGNLLYDVHRSAFAHGGAPNNGIFFDQGSRGYLVEGNIIYATSGKPIRFNQTEDKNMTWKDNSFGVAPGDAKFPTEAAKKAGLLR